VKKTILNPIFTKEKKIFNFVSLENNLSHYFIFLI